MENFKHKNISHAVIKGFYEVYNELGTGFLESVYENAMVEVLKGYGLLVKRQALIQVYFRKKVMGTFKADLVVENCVLVELKSVSHLNSIHKAQILNYLKATDIEVGLLMNFGDEPEFKRFIFDKK